MFVFLCLVRLPAIILPPPLSLSLSDESHTPTFTHMLFGFLNELIVVVDRSTYCRVARSTPSCCLTDCLHGAQLYASSLPSLLLRCFLPSLFTSSSLFPLFSPSVCSSHLSSFSSTPLFPPMLLLLFILIFLPLCLSLCMCFVPGSQWECVTAAALPVQADSDWFSGASSPGPCRAERA